MLKTQLFLSKLTYLCLLFIFLKYYFFLFCKIILLICVQTFFLLGFSLNNHHTLIFFCILYAWFFLYFWDLILFNMYRFNLASFNLINLLHNLFSWIVITTVFYYCKKLFFYRLFLGLKNCILFHLIFNFSFFFLDRF